VRLAVYHPWIYLTSGIERSFVEIARRSRHDWIFYTHHFAPDTTYPELRDAAVIELTPGVSVRRSLLPLLAAARTIARTTLPMQGEAALLVSSEGLGDFAMAGARAPAVCFCHTPLKIVHDPATAQRLREASRAKWAASRLIGPAFTAADRRMWRGYRHVLANSEETRRRIDRARLRPAGDVEVLRPGVDLERHEAPPGRPPGSGFLVAGRIMWQKNIELAIEAVRLLSDPAGRQLPDDPLLTVAGAVDAKSREYVEALRSRATGLAIRFEPDPTDDRLRELYRSSRGLVFTAPNEDWGMVPLEAMASATPVIAVDRGGPRESVLPGETGWLVEPTPEAFAEHMRTLAALPDAQLMRMRAAARQRAEKFGWQPFVERLDEVMQAVASGRPVPPAAAL
jgi:glycosyltransferase involved in cell wall biosynthesis